MDIVYRLQGIEFEWDEDKAQINFDKHGVAYGESTPPRDRTGHDYDTEGYARLVEES